MVYDIDALSSGDVLRDYYQIHSTLGIGGFGMVYKGWHTELGIYVAIKEFYPSELSLRHNGVIQPRKSEFKAAFDEGLDRFLQEARQLEKFRDCPNIVTCREFFRARGTAYMVMEYVAGMPLSQFLTKHEEHGKPLTEKQLLHIILPLLSALQTIHQSKVYHRDIKPSNIMMRRDDLSPILIDFGAAKHEISKHTKSFAPFTDGYAAMEQIVQENIGPWTDIYGVGAVMWRMVAGGNPPFTPPNPTSSQQRAFKLMHDDKDPLPSARVIGKNRFSEHVLHTIDDCLTVNAKERVQNCNELHQRLTKKTTQYPSKKENHHPQSRRDHSRKQVAPIGRKWAWIIGTGLIATLLLLCVFLLWKTSSIPPIQESRPPLTPSKPPIQESRPPLTPSKPPVQESRPPLTPSKPPTQEIKPPSTPSKPPTQEIKPPKPTVTSPEKCIDVNSASYSQLRRVRGIGDVKARSVITYREQNGPFISLYELHNVKGIGPATIKNFRAENFCVKN